jgi:hypothetical protein
MGGEEGKSILAEHIGGAFSTPNPAGGGLREFEIRFAPFLNLGGRLFFRMRNKTGKRH